MIQGYNIILEGAWDEREVEAAVSRHYQPCFLVAAPGSDCEIVSLLLLPDGFERRLVGGDGPVLIIQQVEGGAHLREE